MQFLNLIGHNLTLRVELQCYKTYCSKINLSVLIIRIDTRGMSVLFPIHQYLQIIALYLNKLFKISKSS